MSSGTNHTTKNCFGRPDNVNGLKPHLCCHNVLLGWSAASSRTRCTKKGDG